MMMRKQDRLIIAFVAALIAYAATYVSVRDVPKYYPLDHTWGFGAGHAGPGMSFYGRVAVAWLAALLALVVTLITITYTRLNFSSVSKLTIATMLSVLIFISLAAASIAILVQGSHWFIGG